MTQQEEGGLAGEPPTLEGTAPHTGLDPVDRVLARATRIERMPVTQRAEAFAEVHDELEKILATDPASLPAGLTPATPGPPAGRRRPPQNGAETPEGGGQ